jgi:hypothetical protein
MITQLAKRSKKGAKKRQFGSIELITIYYNFLIKLARNVRKKGLCGKNLFTP